MRPNNFVSNFSNDNMADSVKLADYAGSDHGSNVRKQYVRMTSGGRDQSENYQDKQKTQIKFEMPQIKNIRTQQSQVSGIESGFKKLKSNQTEKLKQLRNQFDLIRNMPANDRKTPQQQEKLSNSDSGSPLSNPNQDRSSSSIASSKFKKKDTNQRQQRLWHVQRKQYQFMLNNCQLKIQELLHNETEYKKIIHQLKFNSVLTKSPPVQNKVDGQNKQLQKNLKQQKQKNYKLALELQKLKITSKQQTQKISKIQSEYIYKTKDENKISEEKKKLEQALRLEKDRYLNLQIDKRKYQMQNQILQKQKEQQISRYQRLLEHQNVLHQLNLKNITKKFEDQIQIKDRRYMLLLSQFEKIKKQYAVAKQQAKKPVNNNNQMFQLFKKIIQQRKNNNPNEQLTKTMRLFLDKLQTKQQSRSPSPPTSPVVYRPRQNSRSRAKSSSSSSSSSSSQHQQRQNPYTQTLLSQIRLLKAQIEALRNSGEGIDLQPMKKMYQAQIAALKDTIAILQRKIKNIPRDNSPAVQSTVSPFRREKQISELQQRIRELQDSVKVKPQNSFSYEQHLQLILRQKRKLDEIEIQLRTQKKKRSQVQFQLTKLTKQFQFKINMLTKQNQSRLRIKQSQLARTNGNITYWQQQLQNMRRFYQQKLAQKNRLLQQSLSTKQIQNIQKQYEQSLQKAKLDYEKQIKGLAQRISSHKTESLDYDNLMKKYTALQNNYFELQKSIFKSKQINEGVDHLWQIKQTQYSNVNQILKQIEANKRANQTMFLSNVNNRSVENNIYNNFNRTNVNQPEIVTYTTNVHSPTVLTTQDPLLDRGNNLGYNPTLNLTGSQEQQVTLIRSNSGTVNHNLIVNTNRNFQNNVPVRNSYQMNSINYDNRLIANNIPGQTPIYAPRIINDNQIVRNKTVYEARTSQPIIEQRRSNSFVQYDPRGTVMSRTSNNNYIEPQFVQNNRYTNVESQYSQNRTSNVVY